MSTLSVAEDELFAAATSVGEVGQEAFVGEIEWVRVLPVVVGDLLEAADDFFVLNFDR
jgi:hypothetical protein